MSIFSRFSKNTPPATLPAKEENSLKTFVMAYSKAEIPVFKELKSEGWVQYGQHNDFPNSLLEYLDASSIHSGIVNGKAYLIAGDDFLIDGVPYLEVKKTGALDRTKDIGSFIENAYGESWYSIKDKISLDWTIAGAYALKITWSINFSRIVKVEYLPWQNIRTGVKNSEGKIDKYFYSDSWKASYGYKIEADEFPAFDVNSHLPGGTLPEHYESIEDYPYKNEQILYVKNHWPKYEYYGRPMYMGALTAIKATGILSQFYLSSIENGFTPSMLITFNEAPASTEEGNDIRRQIEKQFTVKGIGRKLGVFFAKSKETAPTFTQLDVKNLDSQLLQLQNELYTSIITGHSVTSPELVGVSVPGQLGGSDFELKVKLFNNTVIFRDTAVIERTINELASINGITETIKIKPRTIF